MLRPALTLSALLASCALVSCSGDGEGALVLEVSTNLPVPGGASDLDVEVSQAGAPIFKSQYRLTSDPNSDGVVLPATLVLTGGGDLPQKGSLTPGVVPMRNSGPLGVKVSVSKDGMPLVQRSAELEVPGSGVKRLQIELEQSCINVSCGAGQTCQKAKCVSSAVATDSLPDE